MCVNWPGGWSATMEIDTLYVNTADIDATLAKIEGSLGLKPFLRFELVQKDGSIPIAIVELDNGTLEMLGRTEGSRPASGVICRVEMEARVPQRVDLELAPVAQDRAVEADGEGVGVDTPDARELVVRP